MVEEQQVDHRSPTQIQNAIKEKFQASGNLDRMFGASQQDVAEGNADLASEMVQEQDRTHRGTSPQAQPNQEPQPEDSGRPEGNVRVGSEQRMDGQEDHRVPLRRLNQEIAKRKELEARIESLQMNRQPEPQPQPVEPQAPQGQDYEEMDPRDRHIMALTQTVQELQQTMAGIQGQTQMSEMARYFGGNQDLATLVNEVHQSGNAGLTYDESYAITKVRYPEVFSRGDSIQQGGPAGYTEPPSRNPDLSRQMPDQEQETKQAMYDRLAGARTSSDRKQAGMALIKGRLFG